MKIIVYYHNDADGIVSAGIINKYHKNDEIEFVVCQYSDDISIQGGYDKYYLVDFSFDKVIMERLYNVYGDNFIWIDHHISAMEKNKTLWDNDNLPGMREIGIAACRLTWSYFYPDEICPQVVKLVADYDVWEFKYDETKPFGEALALKLFDPTDEILNVLLNDDNNLKHDIITNMIDKGNTLLEAKKHRVEKTYKNGFDVFFEGCNTRVMFTNHDISEVGNYAANNGYDIGLIITFRKYNITFGLRSIGNVDVSIIATKYGGGGHKNASGFEMDYENGLKFIKELKHNENKQ